MSNERKAGNARVVSVSSRGHRFAGMAWCLEISLRCVSAAFRSPS
jgi:hypothetical protein